MRKLSKRLEVGRFAEYVIEGSWRNLTVDDLNTLDKKGYDVVGFTTYEVILKRQGTSLTFAEEIYLNEVL